MSPFDDCPPDMTDGIDPRAVDALLTGAVAPDDAPRGYAGVASLVAVLRAPANDAERADTTGVVPAMSVAVREGAPEPAPADRDAAPARRGRTRVVGRLVTAKVAAVAAIALAGVTAAGAAAGALPGPAQSAVAGALSHVGVSVPDNHVATTGRVVAHRHDADDQAIPPSTEGLCRATFATDARDPGAPRPPSVLDELARDTHESVHDLCERVAPGSTTAAAPATTPTTIDDRGQAVEPGDDHGDRASVTSPTTATTQPGADDHGGDRSGPDRGGDGSADGGHGGSGPSSQSGPGGRH